MGDSENDIEPVSGNHENECEDCVDGNNRSTINDEGKVKETEELHEANVVDTALVTQTKNHGDITKDITRKLSTLRLNIALCTRHG